MTAADIYKKYTESATALYGSSTAVGAIPPLVAWLSGVSPPTVIGTKTIAALAGGLGLTVNVVVFLARDKARKRLATAIRRAAFSLLGFFILYLVLFLDRTIVLDDSPREPLGLVYSAKVKRYLSKKENMGTSEHKIIAAAENKIEDVYQGWSITTVEVLLIVSWIGTALALQTVFALFTVYQDKTDKLKPPSDKSPIPH